MDYFVSQLQIVLPVLGVNAIRVPQPTVPTSTPVEASTSPIFRLNHRKLGVDAQAQQIDGEFTMLAGSFVVASWHGVGKAQSTWSRSSMAPTSARTASRPCTSTGS
jgi:hypothetical protein